MALKLSCVSENLQKCLPKFTKTINLTAILLILIPEYSQSNVTKDKQRTRYKREAPGGVLGYISDGDVRRPFLDLKFFAWDFFWV